MVILNPAFTIELIGTPPLMSMEINPVNEDAIIPQNGPPLFIAGASDDVLINPQENVMLYNTWIKAGNKAVNSW